MQIKNNYFKNLTILFLIVPLTLMHISCKRINNIDVAVKNVGISKIDNTSIKFGDKISNAGIIAEGATKTQLFFEGKLMETVKVHYELPDNTKIDKKVELPLERLKNVKGDIKIMFLINSDTGEITVDVLQFKIINGEESEVSILK